MVQKILLLTTLTILGAIFIHDANSIHSTENKTKLIVSVTENPTIVWYHTIQNKNSIWWIHNDPILRCPTENSTNVKCNVVPKGKEPEDVKGYAFYGSFTKFLPLPRDPADIWGFIHEESPRNVPQFLHEKGLNLFNFSATFSRHSDIPFPLTHVKLRDITSTAWFVTTKTKNALLSELAPVLYIQSNSDSENDRDTYVRELMKYIPIDSYGLSLHNKDFPFNMSSYNYTPKREYLHYLKDDDFLNFTAQYKFVIAIENGVCNDYTTEKLWRPVVQGVVPLYFGSPMVRDWLPNNKSAILLEEFETPQLVANYLYELLKDDTKYEEHLEHKTKGLITNQKLIDEFKQRPFQYNFLNNLNQLLCLMCVRIHENSNRVNIVTREHYNCSKQPFSLLTRSVNQSNHWNAIKRFAEISLDRLYNRVVYNSSISKSDGYRWDTLIFE